MITKKKPLVFTKKTAMAPAASGAIKGNPDNAADAKKPDTTDSIKSLAQNKPVKKGKGAAFFAGKAASALAK
jgi:hypothetical protein